MYRVATPEDLQGASTPPAWTNRLAGESSPYLLQHAHNPVDWYPWGEEAFARARAADRPILLSIGYAACHWCHVMEHESFSDPHVAAYLNEHFVAIKVDREERPDVDALYIEALSALQGHAGWPANLFLLPDLRPFAGATYLPPRDRYGMPSFRAVLQRIHDLWTTRRADIAQAGDQVAGILGHTLPKSGAALDREGYDHAVAQLVAAQDPRHGGLGGQQKFPQTPTCELLLLGAHDALPGARDAMVRALQAMRRGGLYDHLGGGFHRYCVDPAWTVPHFEKMLYDNAQLLRLYARAAAWLAPLDPEEANACVRVARETVQYLRADLATGDGLFWSSEDADDPGGEGFFYTFTAAQARAVLREGPLPYGITEEGNFEHGRTVLSTPKGRPPEPVRQALLAVRNRRPRPALDRKRVTAWNGLALGALAEAGRLLGFDEWVDTAATCADALLSAIEADGAVRRIPAGDAEGTLADHADLADGLLDLFQARPDEIRWLDAALAITRRAIDALADPEGGFFQARERPDLIARRKDFQDGAEPSGNGRMAEVLRRLLAYGADLDRAWLDRLLEAGSGLMERAPQAAPELWGVVRALAARPSEGPLELVIAGEPTHPDTLAMRRAWNRRWRRQGVLAVLPPGSDAADRYTLLQDRPAGPEGAPLAYVCRHGVCAMPVASAAALQPVLDGD